MTAERAADLRRALTLAAVGASIAAAAWQAELEPGRLWSRSGVDSFADIFGGLLSPDLSPSFLARVGRLAIDSLLIGVLGTALALALGVPLAIAAARPARLADDPNRGVAAREVVRAGSRAALALFRAVPEIVWAFLFVRIFGLGPGPAVLALGLTYGGIIGKLYAELLEAADPAPARALRAAGAGRLAVLAYGRLPLVRAQWIAYALFRLECAIRSASILGVVGAGGLGAEIDLSIRYFQYDKLGTTLLAVLAYVLALELASHALRRARSRWTVAALVTGAAAALAALDIPWREMATSRAAAQARAFVAGFGEPTLTGAFLGRALALAVDTVAMAWCATVLAAALASALAPLSAATFTVGSYLGDAPRGRGVVRWLAVAVVAPARAVLQVTRALPDLVWAMLFIVWVEPGPTAGILALTVHTVGTLGRLFTDVLEEAEPAPARALEAAGAGPLGRYLYGVMPQALPRMVAFALFRFEVNIRGAAMVGFVGAGGLGNAIHTAISLFHWNDLAALLLVLAAVVVGVDWAGDRLRVRLLAARR